MTLNDASHVDAGKDFSHPDADYAPISINTLSHHDPVYRELFRRADTDGVRGVSREELTFELTNIYQSDSDAASLSGKCAATRAAEAAVHTVDQIFKNAGVDANQNQSQLKLLQMEGGIKKIFADLYKGMDTKVSRDDIHYLAGFERWLADRNQPHAVDVSGNQNWVKESLHELVEASQTAGSGDLSIAAKKVGRAFATAYDRGGLELVGQLAGSLHEETKNSDVLVSFDRILNNAAAEEPEYVVVAFSNCGKIQRVAFPLQ